MAKRRNVRTDGRPRLEYSKEQEVWLIRYNERVPGADGKTKTRSKRRSTGTADKVEADTVFAKWKAARARAPSNLTVTNILDAYVQLKCDDDKNTTALESALVPVRPHFGLLAPEDITPATVREYIRDRRKATKRRGARGGGTVEGQGTVSDRAISVELAYLRAALKWAEAEKWIEEAPFIKLPPGAGVNVRTRSLTREDVRKLLDATKHPDTAPHIRTFVLLALSTAQRGVAIRNLKWAQVDFEGNTIWFSKTGGSNNKRRANVPMVPPLRARLEEMQRVARTPYVIEYRDEPVRDLKTGFAALVKRAGLEDVHIHDLRRTAATLALQAGRSFSEVAAMLKQNVGVTQAHYAHASPAYLLAVAEAIMGEDVDLVAPVALISDTGRDGIQIPDSGSCAPTGQIQPPKNTT